MKSELQIHIVNTVSILGVIRDIDLFDYCKNNFPTMSDELIREVISESVQDSRIKRIEYVLPNGHFRLAIYFPIGTLVD